MRIWPIVALLILARPAAGQTRYKMELEETRTVTGTLTFSATFRDLQAKEWIAFAAVAPELPGQRKVKTAFDFPKVEAVKEKGGLGREVLMARVPARTDDLKTGLAMKAEYTATLYSRNLAVAGEGESPEVPALAPAERKAALADSGDIDFKDAGFQKWLKAGGHLRRKAEGEIAFARRTFAALRAGHTYEFKGEMDRKASAVCERGKSDCGGLSLLFAAAMRANGIPARTLFGRWATSAKPADKLGDVPYFQWHVKAEFYAAEVGWVPVDVAAGILHDKSADGLEHFGRDAGDFLTMHIDANFQLDTGAFGKQTVHNLQVPPFWVTGIGKPDQRRDKEGWVVEVKK